MSKPSFAVILSGCGVYDGSEIHEAVLTLLAIEQAGGTYRCFAPDRDQMHVVNHLTGEATADSRNVLVESARIARGAVQPMTAFKVSEFDALVLPGGFGAAKNLSTFAVDGPACTVEASVESAITAMHKAEKPIGALCIAPALLARVLGAIDVTIGSDDGVAQAITTMGATHHTTSHGQTIIDARHKVVTTPCYMLDASISQINDGARAVIGDIMTLLGR